MRKPEPEVQVLNQVLGHCPACGRQTLDRAPGGAIVCGGVPECPHPDMVTTLLIQDAAETDHIVLLEPDSWTIRHPLRERIGSMLEDCPLAPHVAGLDPTINPLGRYRVRRSPHDRGWIWELAR